VAERRAAHQVLDNPKVFDDPLALAILRPEVARQLRENARREKGSPLSGYMRAFVSMRSRFAEDALRRAYGRGVRQYVIVGAGFDTFAYRNPYPDLPVFEIDHPDTQAVKRSRLEAARIDIPGTLTFVTVDLTRAPFVEGLASAGFDARAPAFVAWLGVSMYLSPDDVRATLRAIGRLAIGTGLVLDYAVPPSSLSWVERMFYGVLLRRVARIGEPWKTFLTSGALAAELTEAGLEVEEDLGPLEINQRYFANRSDGLKVSSAGRIASARVVRTVESVSV